MIGVIADDLTGAAEIGAGGWRHGLRAEVGLASEFGAESDLVCVNTDSRGCSSDEAALRARDAAAHLRRAGAQWIYKKVDSVLRGQVIPEIEAIMRELGMTRALLAPTNPSRGRIIRGGEYFVQGRRIHETEFARDPEHPRQSARVLDLLSGPKFFPICVKQVAAELPEAIIVAEAASSDDLRHWATRHTADILPAGGAEFFDALLAATGHTVNKPAHRKFVSEERDLFLCGSTSESSQAFVRGARAQGMPVFSLPPELATGADFSPACVQAIAEPAAAALRKHGRVILCVGLPMVLERAIAVRLVPYLVQAAEAVLRQVSVGHVCAEGGATAAALLQRMNWKHLQVVDEPSPGVVTLSPAKVQPRITIKPGSYLWPTEMRR